VAVVGAVIVAVVVELEVCYQAVTLFHQEQIIQLL
jgi:hypothetical protein